MGRPARAAPGRDLKPGAPAAGDGRDCGPRAPAGLRRSALLLWLSLSLAATLALLWRPAGIAVQIEGKHWRRTIEIERRADALDSAWCRDMPADARDIERHQLADPQRGGTLAEHCRYRASLWRAQYSIQAEGSWPAEPHWPAPQLGSDERAGQQHEINALSLRSASDQRWTCNVPLPAWRAYAIGLALRLRVDRQGVADCASLPTPS